MTVPGVRLAGALPGLAVLLILSAAAGAVLSTAYAPAEKSHPPAPPPAVEVLRVAPQAGVAVACWRWRG